MIIDHKEIGKKIRLLRKMNNMTATELAIKMGIDQPKLSKLELGRLKWSVDLLMKVSEIFEIPVDQIISGNDLKPLELDKNKEGLVVIIFDNKIMVNNLSKDKLKFIINFITTT